MRRSLGVSASILGVSVTILVLALVFVVPAGQVHAKQGGKVRVSSSVHNDVSAPLSSINGKPSVANTALRTTSALATVRHGKPNNLKAPVQTQVGTSAIPSPTNNFDGVGNGFTGPQGTFTVAAAPPDTNGTVGPHDFVQTVNTDFAIFNKDPARGTVGTVRYGPVAINTLWSGFGGLCPDRNDGELRWSIAGGSLDHQPVCRHQPGPNFFHASPSHHPGDRPHLEPLRVLVQQLPGHTKWRSADAYYETLRPLQCSGTTFLGAEDCAFNQRQHAERHGRPSGSLPATSFGGLLPSDLDSATLPPSGSPNCVTWG
jgi:hypothetical protein